MPRFRSGQWWIAVLLPCLALLLLLTPGGARGYERWSSGCSSCHGDYNLPYVSEVTGQPWPGSLHAVHSGPLYMATHCDLCHHPADEWSPWLGVSAGTQSNGGFGCLGCHGRTAGLEVPERSGLLNAHHNAGIVICEDCHSLPAEIPSESQPPPYYGSVDTAVTSPCNNAGQPGEDWNGDGLGLDNDGDRLWDRADPDCREEIFSDGFETGNTTAWAVG